MSRVLETGCARWRKLNLFDRGYGERGVDFLSANRKVDNIIMTNPPYNSAEAFVAAGVRQAKRKVALLLRLAFLEGANRAKTIFGRAATGTRLGLQ